MATSSLMGKASRVVAVCARRVLRATRRLLHLRAHRRIRRDKQLVSTDDDHQELRADEGEAEGDRHQESCADEGDAEGEDGLWRRAILMGERCKPLDFPDVIHYDSFGRRLSAPPQRGGVKAALLCSSMYNVDEATVVAPRKAMTNHA